MVGAMAEVFAPILSNKEYRATEMETATADVTLLLRDISNGREGAFNELFPVVYDQLKSIARGRLNREAAPGTFAATDLVHEAYLKLVRHPERVDWKDRNHFYAVVSRAMRQVLVTRAIARKATKRGSGVDHVSFDENIVMSERRADELLAIDEGLKILGETKERLARIVELRYFGGFSIVECAGILGVSEATVNRDWRVARVWLYNFVSGERD